MPADLRITGLSKHYPTPGDPLVVLEDLSLEMSRGDALAIMGPSGSGKSTLLYILGSLDQPTAGSVEIAGIEPFSLDAAGLAKFRNTSVGFIFQDHHLLPQCSALENVLIPTMENGSGPAAIERAKALLERVGLADRMTHLPAELSGGERQRVAIARALINKPPVVLADEPTGNLDRRSAETIATLLLDLYGEENVLLIAVTHSAELAARFPRRAELVDGKLEFATA